MLAVTGTPVPHRGAVGPVGILRLVHAALGVGGIALAVKETVNDRRARLDAVSNQVQAQTWSGMAPTRAPTMARGGVRRSSGRSLRLPLASIERP